MGNDSSATKQPVSDGEIAAGDAAARFQDGQVIIRVDAALLKSAAESAEFARDAETGEVVFRVTDAGEFAKIVCRELNDDTSENGLSRIQNLLDQCIDKAAEDGSDCCQFKFKGKWE